MFSPSVKEKESILQIMKNVPYDVKTMKLRAKCS